MRWPLRYQILFPFAGLFFVVIMVITTMNAYLAVRASEQRTKAQLREVARTLLTSSFPLTDGVLRQMRGLSGSEFAVTAPDGSMVAASMKADGELHTGQVIAHWQQFEMGEMQVVGDETYFHAALALARRSDRVEPGLLHILYPERTWREARWQAIFPPLAVGALSLAGVGGLAFAIAARLSKPIQSLQMQVGRLAEGDFQTVRLPAQNDELRDLAESVNTLADQLADMRCAIKRSERLTLLGQLSGGLAHHLRNHVTGARMAIQLHEQDCPAEDTETLAVALRQLTLAEQHLQQFFSAGQPRPPHRVRCDLQVVVDELISLVGPTCKHHRVDLQKDFSSDQPQQFVIDADPEQLRQGLLNLVLNAIDAAGPEGWVRIEGTSRGRAVCAESEAVSCCVRLRVFDSGRGVRAEIADRLFEPFTTGKTEGVGLGLTVSRQIAEAHGGTLHYSRDGVTCFEISLPVSAAATSPEAQGLPSLGFAQQMAIA